MEGNITWEKRVLWTGRIRAGSSPAEPKAEARYLPDASPAQEGPLVVEVAARFRP